MFATVYIDDSIELPYFPEELDRGGMTWQSKQGINVYKGPYRITSGGRLERKEISKREKTPEEKQSEAEKWGFKSWEDYLRAYEENEEELLPPEIDYDLDEGEAPPVFPSEKTVDETWWGDCNMHGTFEFHQLIRHDPIEYEKMTDSNGNEFERPTEYALTVFLEYEARFTEGDLDKIVFMGERGIQENPVESAIEKIENWRESRESN